MIKLSIKGLKKVQRNLKRLEGNIKGLDGKVITAKNKEELRKKISKELFKGL